MKTRNILFTGLVSVAALLSSCNDFQEINEDPNLVGEDKVKPCLLYTSPSPRDS